MIAISRLQVDYGRHQEPVLKGINTALDQKSLILGPNGSGKTTLFRAICGLTNVSSGEILIDGKKMGDIYATIGLVSANFEEVYTLLMTDCQNLISLYMDLVDGDAGVAYDISRDLGLERDFLKKRRINELSAGQRKIVCTAMALASKANHVLLDEPFEQLDPAKKGKLTKHLDSYRGLVILNTHETWLLRSLQDWLVFFMFEGLMYGPVSVNDLLKAEISFSEEPDAVLNFRVSGKPVSICKGIGNRPLLTSLENLDRIYELAESEMK